MQDVHDRIRERHQRLVRSGEVSALYSNTKLVDRSTAGSDVDVDGMLSVGECRRGARMVRRVECGMGAGKGRGRLWSQ